MAAGGWAPEPRVLLYLGALLAHWVAAGKEPRSGEKSRVFPDSRGEGTTRDRISSDSTRISGGRGREAAGEGSEVSCSQLGSLCGKEFSRTLGGGRDRPSLLGGQPLKAVNGLRYVLGGNQGYCRGA
ncbi:hypothetical protein TREES_T100018676 [Tupaia chinensis]|uniref:Uncharacterized protein n=1 Tax=Tupaia chinensis TaxID=246437 RepID=L9KLL5_TUPCH|nr:hypothetical protein TREES_T100018676 [Tupaia chinensis]